MTEAGTTEYLPIVYLPGAGGRWTTWEPIASVLASRREPLLFDYPGLGETEADPEIDSLDDLARWIAEAMPERCDLIALSMGSALAFRLLLDHPDRIRRLVLVTPCGGLGAASFGALDWRESFRALRPHAPSWFADDQEDFGDRLSRITVPTLIVMGDEDLVAPVAIGEFLLERLPSAKLEVIGDTDHDLEEQQPALLASLIEAHLRR
jgi:poly(3-hydroxyoctanoate) depolymerase